MTLLLAAGAPAAGGDGGTEAGAAKVGSGSRYCVTPDEVELSFLVNEYRTARGLPPLPLSSSLTHVARVHVHDLAVHEPGRRVGADGKRCGLHSWSDAGPWSAVRYTGDQRETKHIESKPWELTGGLYWGKAFEDAYWTTRLVTPYIAFAAWKRSPVHAALMTEDGKWRGETWANMGFALSEHYAVAWFGDTPDPLGEPPLCGDAPGPLVRTPHDLLTPSVMESAALTETDGRKQKPVVAVSKGSPLSWSED